MYQKWLQAFHHVATARSFTGAAKQLDVGQPTISVHVSNLEAHFDVELFHRKGRKIFLTPEGENLFSVTRNLFGHEQEAIAYLQTLKILHAGELHFSAVRPYDIIDLLAVLRSRRPGIRCAIRLRSSENVINDLLDFRADFGIVSRKSNDKRVHCVFYKRHKVLVVVNRRHRLASKKKIQLRDLAGEHIIRRAAGSTTQAAFDDALAKEGVAVDPVLEIESPEGLREAVIRGFGIGALSETVHVPHTEICSLTVTDADMYSDAYIACLAARMDRPLIGELLSIADEMVKKRKK